MFYGKPSRKEDACYLPRLYDMTLAALDKRLMELNQRLTEWKTGHDAIRQEIDILQNAYAQVFEIKSQLVAFNAQYRYYKAITATREAFLAVSHIMNPLFLGAPLHYMEEIYHRH